MDTYAETFETWNKLALLYQNKFMSLDIYNKSYDAFCKAVFKLNSSILEIGCGPGNITKYLIKMRPDFEILGLDIAPNMVALAQENNPSARFKVMDCREIHQLNSKYDGIVIGFCVPYLSETDVAKLLSDCSNLLNPDGSIYLSFVEGESNKSGFKTGSTGICTYFYFHRLVEIIRMLSEAAFTSPDIIHVQYEIDSENKEIHTVLISNKL
ncbi:MAG: class I SAM-dependent methyltransferase [Bacteroidia bacterium]